MQRLTSIALITVVAVLMAFTVHPVSADSKKILAAIDAAGASCRGVSQQIWEFKELGQQEVKSAALLKEELAKLGYKVTGDLKVPDDLVKDGISKTAFKAEMAGKGPGPTVTLMLEYDALANGHACGHNLIATSGLLAAAGLAKVMKETPGRVFVIGTPDEERGSQGGGKVALLEGGHFDGLGRGVHHAPDRPLEPGSAVSRHEAGHVHLQRQILHAAASPHKGVNALRGGAAHLQLRRQPARAPAPGCPHSRHRHEGRAGVNIVPELAQAEFACRALDTATMENAYAKVVNCAKAAELGTGATLEFSEPGSPSRRRSPIPALLETVQANLEDTRDAPAASSRTSMNWPPPIWAW